VGDVGFWQGAFRDSAAPGYEQAWAAIEARQPWAVELLYADHEGGQRAISRFLTLPVEHQILTQPGDHQGQAGGEQAGLARVREQALEPRPVCCAIEGRAPA
jgi:hypothetical protein